jgi:hypothetical protein
VERPVIGDIDRHMLISFKSSLRAAACVWRVPIFRVLRCVERPVIGDIDRHMLISFKSSLRAAACVWRVPIFRVESRCVELC